MPYGKDNSSMFAAYCKRFESPKLVVESTETDAKVIAKTEDPANDGPKVTDADMKAANYIANKRKAIEDSIASKKKESEDEEKEAHNGMHSDALYIWEYLLHQKKYSPADAMNVVNMAKVAFEHMLN
jgi:hypothetical protein